MDAILLSIAVQTIAIVVYGYFMYRMGHQVGLKKGMRAVLTLHRILRHFKGGA